MSFLSLSLFCWSVFISSSNLSVLAVTFSTSSVFFCMLFSAVTTLFSSCATEVLILLRALLQLLHDQICCPPSLSISHINLNIVSDMPLHSLCSNRSQQAHLTALSFFFTCSLQEMHGKSFFL